MIGWEALNRIAPRPSFLLITGRLATSTLALSFTFIGRLAEALPGNEAYEVHPNPSLIERVLFTRWTNEIGRERGKAHV